MDQLPLEILRSVYEFDSTYHEIYKTVVREVKTIGELTRLFKGSLVDILTSPSILLGYTKKDFELYASFLGSRVGSRVVGQGVALHLTSRKLTRRRLLRKLLCHHLRIIEVYELDINSLWVLG